TKKSRPQESRAPGKEHGKQPRKKNTDGNWKRADTRRIRHRDDASVARATAGHGRAGVHLSERKRKVPRQGSSQIGLRSSSQPVSAELLPGPPNPAIRSLLPARSRMRS